METAWLAPYLAPPLHIYPPAEFSVAYILCIWFAVDIFYRKSIFDRQPCAGCIAAPEVFSDGLHAPEAQKKGEPKLPFTGSCSEPYMSKRLYQSCNCTDTGPAASSVQ